MGCKKCFSFAAEARNKIDIVTVTETDDGAGGQAKASETVSNIHARVKPTNGFERFNGQRIESNISHKILIRYRSDLAVTATGAKKTIRVEGRDLNINFIRNLHHDLKREGKVYQEIYAVEGERGAV